MADTIRRVDPKTLVIAPNVRTNTKITKAFVASIKEHGVKVPIEVHDVGGELQVLDGQRRTLAAVDVGLADVPIIVTPVSDDTSARIVDQLVMNEQREQLTRGERVNAVQELALIGIPAGEIAKRTSVEKGDVEKAIKVANSAPALAAVVDHEITLDQAAALVEFEGHPKVLADLIERAKTGRQFEYYLHEARNKVALAASKKKLTEKLKRDGVPLGKESDFYGYGNGPGRRLDGLVDASGKEITPAAHKKCPGHTAFLQSGWQASSATIIYACSDWEANGHKKKGGREETPAERKEREREERERAKFLEAKTISTELREEFIVSLLQRDVAKLDGAFQFIADGVVGGLGDYRQRGYAQGLFAIAAGWLKLTVPEGGDAARVVGQALERPGAKPLAFALAGSLAIAERLYQQYTMPWSDAAYFRALASWGHALTDFEKEELAAAEAALEEERAAEAKKAADAA
jgi:ParB family chromosome partitioning protein